MYPCKLISTFFFNLSKMSFIKRRNSREKSKIIPAQMRQERKIHSVAKEHNHSYAETEQLHLGDRGFLFSAVELIYTGAEWIGKDFLKVQPRGALQPLTQPKRLQGAISHGFWPKAASKSSLLLSGILSSYILSIHIDAILQYFLREDSFKICYHS